MDDLPRQRVLLVAVQGLRVRLRFLKRAGRLERPSLGAVVRVGARDEVRFRRDGAVAQQAPADALILRSAPPIEHLIKVFGELDRYEVVAHLFPPQRAANWMRVLAARSYF